MNLLRRAALLSILCVPALLAAQTGTIQGTVTDSSGAVIAGAKVLVVNNSTNASRTVETSENGLYSITNLMVGDYTVTIDKVGFTPMKYGDVNVTVAQVVALNAKLSVGSVSETVTVTTETLAPIETETSQISNLVDERRIKDLPLLTRNPYELLLLSPGTIQTNSSLAGISVNGSRERNNNFLLDGVDNNDTSVPGIIGGVLASNPDSTQEFRVITNNFNAEYGRNTGAIVDVVTKSGTNSLHFDAYWFGRYNSFGGARDWFNTVDPGTGATEPMNPYVRNQFGYSVGGPIFKNKTFFFFNNEFQRFRTTLTGHANVPTQDFKNGQFVWHTLNQTDANNPVPVDIHVDLRPSSTQNLNGLPLDQTMQNLFALYPNPTSLNSDGYTGTIAFPSSSKQDSYQTVLKIDHHFTDRETLTLRYGYDHLVDPNPFHLDFLPGGVGAMGTKAIAQSGVANLVSTLSSSMVNSFNFGWNQIYAPFYCGGLSTLDDPSVNVVDPFGRGRDYTFNSFSNFGCGPLLSNGQNRQTGTTSFADTITWVRGAHTWKFGADFRIIRETGPNSFNSRRQVDTRGFFNGYSILDIANSDNLANFSTLSDDASALYGFVGADFYSEYFNRGGTRVADDNKIFRQHEYSFFGQDSWKVRRNLTVNLGLRYQFNGVPYDVNGNMSNLFTDPASFPVVFSLVGPGTGNQLFNDDYSNIEPRIGFSWDPWSDGKTAIRGAFGIFHDRVFGNLFGNARGNPPFQQDYSTGGGDTVSQFFDDGSFPAQVPELTPSATVAEDSFLAPTLFDPHFRDSSSQNWNFGVQREIPGNVVLDLNYVGSKGTHIFRVVEANPPDPARVAQIVDFCTTTGNCNPDQVNGPALWFGGTFGFWPINAVEHTAFFRGSALNRSVGNANYNALQLKVTRRFSHGVEIQGAYTWSHAIDDSNDPLNPAGGNPGFPRDTRHLELERGNSDNDIRHAAVINYIWELPFGKGKSYLSQGFVGRVLEGIQISGITTLQTGHPFDFLSGVDTARTGRIGRVNQIGDPFAPGSNDALAAQLHYKAFFRNPEALQIPAFGTIGSLGKNHFYGPSYINSDLSIAKKMKLGERLGLELRFEGYNIFNRPQFSDVGTDVQALGNVLNSPIPGLITSTLTRSDGTTSARQLQAAMKLTF
jgi:hypothetical protein